MSVKVTVSYGLGFMAPFCPPPEENISSNTINVSMASRYVQRQHFILGTWADQLYKKYTIVKNETHTCTRLNTFQTYFKCQECFFLCLY